MIRLSSPEWLLLLPMLALAAWWMPQLGWRRPLRILCLLVLVAVLAHPHLRRRSAGLDVWVLADRSRSAETVVEPRLGEIHTLLERSRSRDDRLFWIDFGDDPWPAEGPPQAYAGGRSRTRTSTAIRSALARLDPDRSSRLLLLTDGYSTEPLADAGARLASQSVPLDYRLFQHAVTSDWRVADFQTPVRLDGPDPFLIDAAVEGTADGPVPYTILRDGRPLSTGLVQVVRGRGHVRFGDRLAGGGARLYEFRIRHPRDTIPGNDAARQWVDAGSDRRILLVTSYTDDPLASTLAGQGWSVDVVTAGRDLTLGRLAGARAAILNNVPASELPVDALQALVFYVRDQGGGLLMAGGRASFAAGGYSASPVDPILPVSMELKTEHRKMAVAMAIVLDRSGSMSAGVPGQPGLTKMDLADQGAARAVERLGSLDAVAVLPVDSAAHVLVPLTSIGNNRAAIVRRIRRIESMGGGIFVYEGLNAAWHEIRRAPQAQKHVILFADASDSEEPGDYVRLLEEMTKAGATVSVIGMGRDSDFDAQLLVDIARRGNGRIFFCDDVAALPALFEQETVAVSRSAFIKDPVRVNGRAGWLELSSRPIRWLDAVDGYNLCYLRDGATAAAVSADEYAAPLAAFWQRGLGRAAAVTFPLGGEYSGRARAWPAYTEFVGDLVRWTAGRDTPPGIGLRTSLDGEMLRVDLQYDRRWEADIARRAPRLVTAAGAGGPAVEETWRRLASGRLGADIRLPTDGPLRGAVQVGGHSLPLGPVGAGAETEWKFDRQRVADLRKTSERSGGAERLDIASIWKSPRPTEFRPLRPWLLAILLILFLAEALLTRLGVDTSGKLAVAKRERRAVRPETPRAVAPAPVATDPGKPPEAVAVPEETAAAADSDTSAARRDLFKRAKKGR